MTSKLKPKYLRCYDEKGNLCKAKKFLSLFLQCCFVFCWEGRLGGSFKPKCLCRTCWSWVSVKTVPQMAAVLGNLILGLTLVFLNSFGV